MKEPNGNRQLLPFSGWVFYPHDSDRTVDDKRKRCVIWAYSEYHAKELTYMLLPPMRDRDRFDGFKPGCREYERHYNRYPGVYVALPGTSMQSYERLDHFYLRPEPFSKNTQRKIGIDIGTTYSAGPESRKVETITADKAQLETLGLFENGDDLVVHYRTPGGLHTCTVREFQKWRDKAEATVTEVHTRKISLKHGQKALLEAACLVLATAKGTKGIGDVVNAVMADEIKGQYVANGGLLPALWGVFNSMRHMALIQFEGPALREGDVPDAFDFWVSGKGWCHWSKWKDELILTSNGALDWDDRHLELVDPAIRKQFLAKRGS